jgi:hypothetical protein
VEPWMRLWRCVWAYYAPESSRFRFQSGLPVSITASDKQKYVLAKQKHPHFMSH